MIAITGATGQLGRLVIRELLQTVPAARIVALARSADKAADLAAEGITVRIADYDQPERLEAALAGVTRLLLISSSQVGQRVAQHRNVIDAARRAGVAAIAYTSLLHTDRSPLGLAAEHVQTEALLTASGLQWTLLRNGWYTENYLAGIPAALAHGALIGCAGDARIASAARADYAAAAARVLASDGHAGKIYELAGDEAYTLTALAAEISRQSGKPVVYRNLDEAGYRDALTGAGLPPALAAMLADSDRGAAAGGLFDDSHQLSQLIGRPTTTLTTLVAHALA